MSSSAPPSQRSLPVLQDRVLPTLNVDGTRRWIRPKLFSGRYLARRRWAAYLLMAVFAGLPLLQIAGKPAVLLDILHREFTFFGLTFRATEGVLLMLLMLASFLSVFWLTALVGRVWCGYACPQTVYLEFLFRPIERWLEGSRGQQLKLDRDGANARRVLKLGIYGLLALVLGNIFLSYFVGAKQLAHWLTQSPLQHPTPFFVVIVVSGLVLFNFAYFREQMCTVVCPYARLQSVLLDKQSLIVAYDSRRGEPRGHIARRANSGVAVSRGDCIDCKACVVACPTGIDIRDGLQLECITCAQCVDACDGVMKRQGKPLGLIRYSSQAAMSGARRKSIRPRVVLYPLLIVLLVAALVWLGRGSAEPRVTILRGIGAPYVIDTAVAPEAGELVRNQLRVKVHNRGAAEQRFFLRLEGAGDSQLIAPENPLPVAPNALVTTTLFVESPRGLFVQGQRQVTVVVESDDGFAKRTAYKLLGPL